MNFWWKGKWQVFFSSQPKVGWTVIYKVFLSHKLKNQLKCIIWRKWKRETSYPSRNLSIPSPSFLPPQLSEKKCWGRNVSDGGFLRPWTKTIHEKVNNRAMARQWTLCSGCFHINFYRCIFEASPPAGHIYCTFIHIAVWRQSIN